MVFKLVLFSFLFLLMAPAAPLSPQVRCEKAGGKWGPWGLAQKPSCNLPTADAGRACTDSKQCATACVVKESATPPPPGTAIQGECFGWKNLGGSCVAQIHAGQAAPVICTD